MSKATVVAGWDDVPHLSAKTKAELAKEFKPHQRASRTKGIPSMGAGAIYPVEEDDIKYKPMAMPAYWPRAYALDVGWKRTAAIWGAKDRDTGVIYAYAEYYRGEVEPSVHAAALRAKGDWIPGIVDPAARGRSQIDGQKLLDMYKDLGLVLHKANNSVETGLYTVWERLSTGTLKLCSTLENTFAEYRLYRRDDKGAVVKENDHLMDALRYLVMTFDTVAIVKPFEGRRKVGSNTYV